MNNIKNFKIWDIQYLNIIKPNIKIMLNKLYFYVLINVSGWIEQEYEKWQNNLLYFIFNQIWNEIFIFSSFIY